MSKQRYFDYAATTPLNPKVFSVMLPYFKNEFGNPSNLYKLGRNANLAISESTKTIAKILGCHPEEFIYTGGATEADNLAILGTARANRKNSSSSNKSGAGKIIISSIEHKGILSACEALKKETRLNPSVPAREDDKVGQDFEIVKLPLLKNGLVDLNVLKKELDDKTILVSITMADSETGTIQPIAEISKIIKENSTAYFHTDASQSAGYLDIDVEKLGVDMMTISAHKLYGPKGIGGLYVRKGIKLEPIIYGGGQQKSLRSGTENVPAIVGFAKALELNFKNKKSENVRIKKLRDTLEKGILKNIPKVILNGHPTKRLPNFLNISILDVEGEALLLYLDELGIMVSTGSACNSQSLEPSYILSALGYPYEYIHGSLRFTLGSGSSMQDVHYVLKHLPKIVKKLRAISPLNLKLNQTKKISNPKAFINKQTPHFLK
jgi:cysteine desulfurase